MKRHRDIARAVKEYDRRREATGKEPFYASDLQQIADMIKDDPPADRFYNAVLYAMKAGYIVGLRSGKRKTGAA